ncbi:SIS domain-containing protein [Algoriphagus sediminis]|uniref:SIS domain-containing protein n=1 Tax=Algoriphagus sediminis TaxID=3057113 RepID=A0ABT7YAG9_9BACT|nr:SIS domain-containing protein [Algoriphagus sediminis]MDN3203499.1 SIS domain-containing protein [Algoriphagus sediminis]
MGTEDLNKAFLSSIYRKLELAANQKSIDEAGNIIAGSLEKNGWIYAFGTGHSHMMAEEIFYRAGGLARVRPILHPKLMLHEDASASTDLEREEGKAKDYLGGYQMTNKDVILIASNSGRNAVTIDLALLAKAKKGKIIALTSLNHSKSVESRHTSGLKLFQLADVVLDNFGEIGDTSITLQKSNIRTSPSSTIVGSFILNLVITKAIELLISKGLSPEVFQSSNLDSGGAHNENLINKYKSKVKGL